jgi:hypothetical protein
MKLRRVGTSVPIPSHAVGSTDPHPRQRHWGVLHPEPDCDRRGVCKYHRPRDSRDPLQAALLIGERERYWQASDASGDRYSPPLECRARRRGGREQDGGSHDHGDQPPTAQATGAAGRPFSHVPDDTQPAAGQLVQDALRAATRALRRRRPLGPDGPQSQAWQSHRTWRAVASSS